MNHQHSEHARKTLQQGNARIALAADGSDGLNALILPIQIRIHQLAVGLNSFHDARDCATIYHSRALLSADASERLGGMAKGHWPVSIPDPLHARGQRLPGKRLAQLFPRRSGLRKAHPSHVCSERIPEPLHAMEVF